MFCPKRGEEISVREKEDAEKIRRLREFIIESNHRIRQEWRLHHNKEADIVLEECK